MSQQHDKEYRDGLIDDLDAAIDEWYDREKETIEKEVTFLKSVLKGRTGSERLQQGTTEQTRILVLNDLTSLLAGS